jgi:hypothetical protein
MVEMGFDLHGNTEKRLEQFQTNGNANGPEEEKAAGESSPPSRSLTGPA